MDSTARARELRLQMTDAERSLWRYLRRHFLGESGADKGMDS